MKKNERGQALLIVVLVMVVALTVGLSVASRSITNLKTSTEEANSQNALAAAEAGVEQAIKSNSNVSELSFNNNTASYDTTITSVNGKDILLYGGNPVLQDDGIDTWLSDYSTDPSKIYLNPWPLGGGTENLTIKWGVSPDPCSNAAIEFALIYGTKQSPQVKRYVFDPCSTRAVINHFSPPTSTGKSTTSGKDFYYEATVPISLGLIGRVVPLYANTPVALVAQTTALPSQGSIVTSVGISSGTQRKVNVFQGYPEVPSEYFLNILLSL